MATANQAIGKVFILYGKVKAVAQDGTERVLGPNSVIYANERIVTEADGSVSIMLDGPPPAQIDLGRMSDVLLNEDVYAAAPPEVVKDVAADAEKIQEALEGQGEIELDATAAGGAAGTGGQDVVRFNLDGSEVTPESGAETTGIGFGTVDTLEGATEEVVATAEPEPEPIEVIAYDNYNEAGYTTKANPGEKTEKELIYDDGKVSGVGHDNVVTVDPLLWGVTSNAKPLLIDGKLQIENKGSGDPGASAVSTPAFNVAEGTTTTISFYVDILESTQTTVQHGQQAPQTDYFTWTLYKLSGSNWISFETDTLIADKAVNYEITDGGTYRLVFVANDVTGGSEKFTVQIDNITVTTIIPGEIYIDPIVASGNVLIDPNDLEGSADPEGAQDVVPEGTTLQILDPGTGEYIDVADGTTIEGEFGTLVINVDGSYEYTPYDYEQGFDGGQETFSMNSLNFLTFRVPKET